MPILDFQDEQRAKAKARALYRAYLTLRDTVLEPRGADGTCMNADLLALATRSYVQDIKRLNEYHGIVVADEAKQACYMMKWLIKVRPIQVACNVSAKQDHLLVNEIVALRFALNVVKVRPGFLSADYIELLLYSLLYRKFEPDSWLPQLALLWRMSRQGLVPREPL